MLTMALAVALVPPGPVQLSEYALGMLSAPVLRVPLVCCGPLQLPDAVQEVACAELQVNIAALPLATGFGDALSVAVGCGADESLAPPLHAVSMSDTTVNQCIRSPRSKPTPPTAPSSALQSWYRRLAPRP